MPNDSTQSDQATATRSEQPLELQVEAVLMSADRPLSPGRIADMLEIDIEEGGGSAVEQSVDTLNDFYDDNGRSFRIERVAGGYRVMIRAEFGRTVEAYGKSRSAGRLSPAALETLAIVAYRQPITRSDVEAIRGVACGEVLRSLLDRHLLKITGRAEEIGRPMLYGTTKSFLEVFGLASLKDLPDAKELK